MYGCMLYVFIYIQGLLCMRVFMCLCIHLMHICLSAYMYLLFLVYCTKFVIFTHPFCSRKKPCTSRVRSTFPRQRSTSPHQPVPPPSDESRGILGTSLVSYMIPGKLIVAKCRKVNCD